MSPIEKPKRLGLYAVRLAEELYRQRGSTVLDAVGSRARAGLPLLAALLAMVFGLASAQALNSAGQEPPAPVSTEEGKAVVIFRYDDVGAYTPQDASAEFAVDRAVFEAFAEHDLPLVVGVVPCSAQGSDATLVPSTGWLGENPEVSTWLVQRSALQRIEFAQHGVTHERVLAGVNSEFRGVAYDIQRARILAGKLHLERLLSIPIRTFVPPWNDYDENTLLVLRDLGFTTISDDWKGTEYSDLLPRVPQTTTLEQLSEILDAYANIPAGSLIVVLFHRYDFAGTDDGARDVSMSLPHLQNLIENVSRRSDLTCMSASNYADRWGETFSRSRHRAAKRYVSWASYLRGLPWAVGPARHSRPGVLFPKSQYDAINVRMACLGVGTIAGFMLSGGALGFLIAWTLWVTSGVRGQRAARILGVLAGVSATAVVVVRLTTGSAIGSRTACAGVFVLGFCATCLFPRRQARQVDSDDTVVRIADGVS